MKADRTYWVLTACQAYHFALQKYDVLNPPQTSATEPQIVDIRSDIKKLNTCNFQNLLHCISKAITLCFRIKHLPFSFF